jgi:hypothetical protein
VAANLPQGGFFSIGEFGHSPFELVGLWAVSPVQQVFNVTGYLQGSQIGVLTQNATASPAFFDIASLNWGPVDTLFIDGGRGSWVDDIEVQPVPAPAALPLFATGLGLMAWLARRRYRLATG